jgi:hypothetical protein
VDRYGFDTAPHVKEMTMTRIFGMFLLTAAMFVAAGAPGEAQTARPLAFFADPNFKTSNASIAVDRNGGTHLAFYYYEPANHQRPT